MDKTVQPERKLMVVTVSRWSMSSTGLMTTPPPMPQMAPTMLASRLTMKNRIINASKQVDFCRPPQSTWASMCLQIALAAAPLAPLKASGSKKRYSVSVWITLHRLR